MISHVPTNDYLNAIYKTDTLAEESRTEVSKSLKYGKD
jgi:hypothetical protein